MYNQKPTVLFSAGKTLGMKFESLVQSAKFEYSHNEEVIIEGAQKSLKAIICSLEDEFVEQILPAVDAKSLKDVDFASSFNSLRKAFYSIPRRRLTFKPTKSDGDEEASNNEPATKRQKF